MGFGFTNFDNWILIHGYALAWQSWAEILPLLNCFALFLNNISQRFLIRLSIVGHDIPVALAA